MLDPFSASQLGPIGIAILCIGMFITNVIKMKDVEKSVETSNESTSKKIDDLQSSTKEHAKTMSDSHIKLSEILQVLVANQSNQSEAIRDVIKELINVIREG